MKKILIGTHNKGKFKEIGHLLSKKYKKVRVFNAANGGSKQPSGLFTYQGLRILGYKFDAVLGARFLKESKLINFPLYRIFGNKVFNFLYFKR